MNSLPSEFLEIAQMISEYSQLCWNRGFVEANGGNISVRLPGNLLISTPSMRSKNNLREYDMVISNFLGEKIYGSGDASSELTTHIAIYMSNPDAAAVIHTHPPYTCSYAFTNSLPLDGLSPESVIWTERVGVIPYLLPGSVELYEEVLKASERTEVLLLRNHGLITWGKNLREAWWRTEVMENNCRISHYITERGDIANKISKEQISLLKTRYGLNSTEK